MADDDRFGPTLAGAIFHLADIVVILDGEGRFEHVNPFGLEVLGYPLDDLLGTPMLDIVHPDDLPGVITAIARMLDPDIEVLGRPAQVRVRCGDGTYLRVEANGALGSLEATPGSSMAIFARPTTDADLHEHLMGLLTAGAPAEKTFELVPDFGRWRQPNLLHAVFVLDDDGAPLAFGSPALLELGGLGDPEGPWARPATHGEELFVPVEELAPLARERAVARGVTWVRARPVLDTLHRTFAVVVIAHDRSSPFPAERSTLAFAWYAVDKMAAVLDMALAWRAQAVELRRAAATDPLTGLANRSGFWSRYVHSVDGAAESSISVLCIDLDRFKPVNDTYGHAVGDALLIDVADRLRRVLRPADLVSRLGGDEFTVVVHDLDDVAVAVIADRIVAELCEPFTIGGTAVEIGASIGVASAPSEHFDAEALLDAADKALYEAKKSGRNRWVRAGDDASGGGDVDAGTR